MAAEPVRDPLRNYIIPPEWTGECNEWCAPMHLAEQAVRGTTTGRYFDVRHLMVVAAVRRRGKPLLYLYKHSYTRRYLNIDAAGQAWRYVPPGPSSEGDGRYVRLPSLESAVERLGLWEMPGLARVRDEQVIGGDDWDDDWDDEPDDDWNEIA